MAGSMSLTDREIVGAGAIARRLECSERTVRRMWKTGILPARQNGDRTSPLRMSRKEIEAFRQSRAS